jgi:hypothetical protein
MLKKTHSQDSNSDPIEYGDWNDYALGFFIEETRKVQAQKNNDYLFEDYEEVE